MPPPTDAAADPVPPPTDVATDPVPPPEGEAVADAELEAFGGGPIDLSLLPLYPIHTTKHIWDKEEHDPQKFLNHERKIVALPQPNEEWFQKVLSLSGLKDLCMTKYTTVNHRMLNVFVER
ncbi:hypothetical protein KIW84_051670 [Lathyrus oleraceus]|uniref:Uncharacterized protein n=1 Tax=Pisum sativum TaxID=3888 RepID=A0A9D4WN30_PEA|nr:hypothetical protein KIW84_051670 [Pisum sativum]